MNEIILLTARYHFAPYSVKVPPIFHIQVSMLFQLFPWIFLQLLRTNYLVGLSPISQCWQIYRLGLSCKLLGLQAIKGHSEGLVINLLILKQSRRPLPEGHPSCFISPISVSNLLYYFVHIYLGLKFYYTDPKRNCSRNLNSTYFYLLLVIFYLIFIVKVVNLNLANLDKITLHNKTSHRFILSFWNK